METLAAFVALMSGGAVFLGMWAAIAVQFHEEWGRAGVVIAAVLGGAALAGLGLAT